ncbi:hypothetical protein [Azohydromonas lata]|uniref:hypothetical protein n=1 Tax=Azohydromonas lata TaxID=45677 RepID=UPI0012F4D094|nr:hypothetical protein [Azohydromonas lata]
MDTNIRNFIGSLTRVLLPIVFAVATTAFISIPMALGHVPGDATVARVPADGHVS